MMGIETAAAMVDDVRRRYPHTPPDTWVSELRADYPGRLDCPVNIGAGWAWILRALIEHLLTVGENPAFTEVKEKFGAIKVYYCRREIAFVYEALSLKTCEVCGEPGVLREGGRGLTLCDDHSEGRPPRRPR